MRQEASNKNHKIEESDKNILNIVKTMDKQKKLVTKLKTSLTNKEKELEETKFTLLERDQEILYLRNYLNTLKLDRKKYFFLTEQFIFIEFYIIIIIFFNFQ